MCDIYSSLIQTLQINFPSTMLRFNKAYFLRKLKVHFVLEEHHSLIFQNYYTAQHCSVDVRSPLLINASLSVDHD
jgi:hypothetical protein